MPEISIIIPTYNNGKIIADSINSILNQSFKDFEIIVVDDGSTDNTKEVLKPFIDKKLIKYFHNKKNQGPGAARNKGILASKGKYIAFLDSDDFLLKDSLYIRYNFLEKFKDIPFVFSDYDLMYQNYTINSRLKEVSFLQFIEDYKLIVKNDNSYYILKSDFYNLYFNFSPLPIWTGTVMLRKEILDYVGLFNVNYSHAEDLDLWLRIMKKYQIGYIDKPLAVYNKPGSYLTKNNVKLLNNIINILLSVYNDYENKDILRYRISGNYYTLGYHYFSFNEFQKARSYFFNSLKFNVSNFKSLKYLLITMLPKNIILLLKKLKMQKDQKVKKIAMIVYRFPPVFAGGAIQAIELSKALRSKYNIDSIFITANLSNSKKYDYYNNFKVVRFKTKDFGRFNYFKFAFKVCLFLLFNKNKYDIIHVHSIRPFYFLIRLIAFLLKKPFVISLTLMGHDDPVSVKNKSFLWKLEGLLYKTYDKIICSSTALMKSCITNKLNNIILIPCIISCGDKDSIFKPIQSIEEKIKIKKSLNIPLNKYIVTFVGHIQERKGSDILFKAWKLLVNENFPGILLLVGPYNKHYPNKDFNNLFKDFFSNSKKYNIIFTGNVNHEDVAKYLKISDCFVFPSRREGFGMVVVEAMACGVPVITSFLPDITTDIIEHNKNGLIIYDITPEKLADQIKYLYKNKESSINLSNNSIKTAIEKFSAPIIAQKHVNLYETILEKYKI